MFKSRNISWQQYNILRILRGRKGEPATVKLLTERMMDKMSNASRLVEKLKTKGFVERRPAKEDRRRVDIYITEEGLKVLEEMTLKINASIARNFSHLPTEKAALLSDFLDELRSGTCGD